MVLLPISSLFSQDLRSHLSVNSRLDFSKSLNKLKLTLKDDAVRELKLSGFLTLSLSSEDSLFLYGVNGWDFAGSFEKPDTINSGMKLEPGQSPEDSIQRFNSFGWTNKIGEAEWISQNTFVKNKLQQVQYQWPNYILIDINIIDTTNTCFLGLVVGMLDTTEEGAIGYIYGKIPIVFGWQTIKLVWTLPVKGYVSSMGLAFASFSIDSGYTGAKYQANNLRIGYDNGNITLIDPFQVVWPEIVGIVSDEKQIPIEFALSQNYPNPFNPSTKISFSIPESGNYTLKVYNILGQEITTLIDNKFLAPGLQETTFDGSDFPNGMYVYNLTGNNINLSKKMMLVK
jgi:hypothetical protein